MLVEAEQECTKRLNKLRLRRIAQRFADLAEGVYTLDKHPSLHPVNDQMQADDPTVNFEFAVKRKMVSLKIIFSIIF